MPFKKGDKNINKSGRKQGSPNKTTKTARDLIALAIESQSEFIAPTLEIIREKDPVKYMQILSKLLDFIMPKQRDINTSIEIENPLSKMTDSQIKKILDA